MKRTLRFLRQATVASTLAIAACRADKQGSDVSVADAAAPVSSEGLRHVIATARIDPRFQPALEALRAAVDAGDDRRARAVLVRLLEMQPDDATLELARGFERILDGRDAVAALDLRLASRLDRSPGAPAVASIDFTAVSRDARAFEVRPGPATLHVLVSAIDERGDESRSSESVPIDTVQSFPVGPGEPSRLPLVELPFGLRPGSIATRAIVELELRSGSVRVTSGAVEGEPGADGRELPAMRVQVTSTEIVMLSRDLAASPLSGPEDLARLVAGGTCPRREALSIAVRLPPADRAAALDALARTAESLPEPALQSLAPALRWLAPGENLGEDAEAWRAWLIAHARGSKPRPELQLPRERAGASAGR